MTGPVTVTWTTDRPPGDWVELGGSYPSQSLPPCFVCDSGAGEFCHVVLWELAEPGPETGWMGTSLRFGSVHADRWAQIRARSLNGAGAQTALDFVPECHLPLTTPDLSPSVDSTLQTTPEKECNNMSKANELTAEIEKLTAEREGAKGAARSAFTRKIKKLETERDAVPAEPAVAPVTSDDVVATIGKMLNAPTSAEAQEIGDDLVERVEAEAEAEPAPRSLDDFNAEIAKMAEWRESAKGSGKGTITRKIKRLERERDALYAEHCRADAEAAAKGPTPDEIRAAKEREAAQTPQPAPVSEKVKLADLESQIVGELRAAGATKAEAADIARHGDPVVDAGLLDGYTAARYGQGRWVSNAVVKRVNKGLTLAAA